jgi:hypothetical protein
LKLFLSLLRAKVASSDDPRLELSFRLHAVDALQHNQHPRDRARRLEEKVRTV